MHITHNGLLALLILVCGDLVGGVRAAPAEQRVSLAGPWRFQLDRHDVGIRQSWFGRNLDGTIQLPGSLPAQGIGDDVSVDTPWTGGIVDRSWFTSPQYEPYRRLGHVKVPFWLQPEKYYLGPAWYQREIEIPEAWRDRRVMLFLERPHWETRVWLGDRLIGTDNSLSTPHRYDLGTLLPGKHRLTIRVDNRLVVDVGINSHSVSDHTQGNWNGIVGRIELHSRPPIWIDQQRVFASNDGTVRVEVDVRNTLLDPVRGTLTATIRERPGGTVVGKGSVPFSYARGMFTDGRHVLVEYDRKEITLKLDRPPKLWSEFAPHLYEAETALQAQAGSAEYADTAAVTFGFRELATQGTQFVLNGRKIFLRGTLECCIFPLTGHPPTDVDSWKRILRIAKAHGLNHIRFHSWCPPEAAFVAADEEGFYYQVECASWANQSTTLGDGKPIDQWIYQEADRILAAYGNHPSFMLMLYGNEPGGPRHKEFLAQWVNHYKAGGPPKRWTGKDPRRLYSAGAGWPQIPENQFHVTPEPRIQAWGGGLKSRINAQPPETQTDYRDYVQKHHVPIISHEIGQWCVYPNFDEIPKYQGYLKPKNFEIFRDTLRAHHLGDLARQFVLASGKLQTLCYKEDIESALRTRGMGGFQLLDLHDFPGQGTALVGVLDPFWDSKGYVTAEEFRRFAGSTVPLARLAKRVFTSDENLEADLEVAHFGPEPIPSAVPVWKLVAENGHSLAGAKLPAKTIPIDNGIGLGRIVVPLRGLPAPRRYRLVVGLEGTEFENDWDVWVYPAQVDTQTPPGVVVVEQLEDEALATLARGGKVLWMIPPNRVRGDNLGKVALGFSSIFWNTAWTNRQAPHTLGILCDPKHPALARFPTEYHSNWQWWYLVSRAGAMILDDLPPALRPTVQVIDDWFTNRRLGLVLEAKVGGGSLVVCSIDLKSNLDANPVARQMLHSLLHYMAGSEFRPRIELNVEQVRNLTAEPRAVEKYGARIVAASSFQPGYEPERAMDGDGATIWHTRWSPQVDPMPHWLVMDLGREVVLRGVSCLPRSDMANGRIARCQVFCSNDPKAFGPCLAEAEWPNSDQLAVLRFPKPVRARYVKLLVTAEVNGRPFASLAEIDVLE